MEQVSNQNPNNRLKLDVDAGRKKVIKFSNVSKRFVLHHNRPRSFQEMLTSLFGRRADALNRRSVGDRPRNETFYALREANFGIYEGEAVGIIGENGSGKSTTLKLITRILTPTSGTVTVSGRISALLELGAGFHPDLTGRENVYLNGSLLGFSRRQMDAKLAEIIDFSELNRFMDTPVKHYSSGMYMRLGFAVAISMEPDILITDEVLAVGDEDFQRKCLAKIGEFRTAGKTIIFVSHALEAVRGLCSRAIWIEHGRVREDGPSSEVVDKYLHYSNEKQRVRLAGESRQRGGTQALPAVAEDSQSEARVEDEEQPEIADRRLGPPPVGSANRWGSQEAQITGVYFIDRRGRQQGLFQTGDQMTIRIAYDAPRRIPLPTFGLAIYKLGQVQVNGPNNKFAHEPIPYIEGKGYVDYLIKKLPLLEGHFDIAVSLYDHELINCLDYHDHWYTFDVQPQVGGERYGLIQVDAEWQHVSEPAPQTHELTELELLLGKQAARSKGLRHQPVQRSRASTRLKPSSRRRPPPVTDGLNGSNGSNGNDDYHSLNGVNGSNVHADSPPLEGEVGRGRSGHADFDAPLTAPALAAAQAGFKLERQLAGDAAADYPRVGIGSNR